MAKKEISFGNRLSDTSKSPEQILREKYDIRPIPLDKLYPSKKNTYSKQNIEELAVSISIIGLQHFITVKPADEDGRYQITDGERRYLAHKFLVEEMAEESYSIAMCRVTSGESDTITDYRMHSGNGTNREFTDADRVRYASEIRVLYERLRTEGVIKGGRIRDYVAKMLRVSPSQVSVYSNIENNLNPDLKEAFEAGELKISDANTIASMPQEAQQVVAKEYRQKGNVISMPKKKQLITMPALKKAILLAIAELDQAISMTGTGRSDVNQALFDGCTRALSLLKEVCRNGQDGNVIDK